MRIDFASMTSRAPIHLQLICASPFFAVRCRSFNDTAAHITMAVSVCKLVLTGANASPLVRNKWSHHQAGDGETIGAAERAIDGLYIHSRPFDTSCFELLGLERLRFFLKISVTRCLHGCEINCRQWSRTFTYYYVAGLLGHPSCRQ